RKDEVWISDSGLITIAGGKLTGYRKMAEHVTDTICKQFEEEGKGTFKKSPTKNMRLSGGDFSSSAEYPVYVDGMSKALMRLGIGEEESRNMASFYGTNTDVLLALAEKEDVEPSLPLEVRLKLLYALNYEMALSPSDFFIRRTGAMYFHIEWAEKYKAPVVEYMKSYFGWSEEEYARHSSELDKRIQEAKAFSEGSE
ncbi:MAG TPA: glycerol-3-phosphate dehydrogenase C-terminal domain-containing protein, partial [Bacillaceae bacterium]